MNSNNLKEYGLTQEETGEVIKIHLASEDAVIECEKICAIFGLYEDINETYIDIKKVDKKIGENEINLRKKDSDCKCYEVQKHTFFKDLDVCSSESYINFTNGQIMECEIERFIELLDNIPKYEKNYKNVGIWYSETGVKHCF